MKARSQVIHPKRFYPDAENPPLSSPIWQSVKYTLPSLEEVERLFHGERKGYMYSRISNPGAEELVHLLADLQHTEGGHIFASGVAAIFATYLAFLSEGDHVLCALQSYKPTRAILKEIFSRYGVAVDFFSVQDLASLDSLVKPGKTRLLIAESPSNPETRLLPVDDLGAWCRKNGILFVLDNTFAGFHQNRSEKVDLYIHSLTKFACGHGDAMGGVVLGSKELLARMRPVVWEYGAHFDPFSAFLVLRGMKTYFVRYEAQSKAALELAQSLESHPKVERVYYPGLPSHPDYSALGQSLIHHGSIIFFNLHGGAGALRQFINALQIFQLAGSLGSVDSLVAAAKKFYGEDLTPEELEKTSLCDGSVRLSIGLEDIEDLKADLQQALSQIKE